MTMEEIAVKTHLIIKDIHEEYYMDWCGSIINTKPKMDNGKPIFIIRSKRGSVEMNTIDMKLLERVAKKLTSPEGRAAITIDTAEIYIKQIDDSEKLLGVMTHSHVKNYAPMYDRVYYK